MNGRRERPRALTGGVVLVLSIGLLLAAAALGRRAAGEAVAGSGATGGEQWSSKRRGRSMAASVKLGLVYVSKRRVPNGPDPIHNRREGKSVRPSGRA